MATNSQIQLISCLVGDTNIASLTNILTDNTYIQDFYGRVSDELGKITGLKFDRNQLKKTSMIDGYGAGNKLLIQQLKEDTGDMYFDGLLEAYYQALENITPTMHLLKHTISSIWDSTKTRYQWTLPNGNVTDYNTIETGRITVNPYGMMNIDMLASAIMPSSRSTGLLVNIIHSIDAYVASEMVVRCSKAGVDMTGFDIVTIHDAFRCHPNHAVAMRDIYVALMAEITDGRILEDIIQEISGKEVKSFAKLFKGADVLRSRYAIC